MLRLGETVGVQGSGEAGLKSGVYMEADDVGGVCGLGFGSFVGCGQRFWGGVAPGGFEGLADDGFFCEFQVDVGAALASPGAGYGGKDFGVVVG